MIKVSHAIKDHREGVFLVERCEICNVRSSLCVSLSGSAKQLKLKVCVDDQKRDSRLALGGSRLVRVCTPITRNQHIEKKKKGGKEF